MAACIDGQRCPTCFGEACRQTEHVLLATAVRMHQEHAALNRVFGEKKSGYGVAGVADIHSFEIHNHLVSAAPAA